MKIHRGICNSCGKKRFLNSENKCIWCYAVTKDIFVLMTVAIMLAINIILYISFIHAYFHGYYINVAINEYREAFPELILLTGTNIMGVWCIVYLFKRLKISQVGKKYVEEKTDQY